MRSERDDDRRWSPNGKILDASDVKVVPIFDDTERYVWTTGFSVPRRHPVEERERGAMLTFHHSQYLTFHPNTKDFKSNVLKSTIKL